MTHLSDNPSNSNGKSGISTPADDPLAARIRLARERVLDLLNVADVVGNFNKIIECAVREGIEIGRREAMRVQREGRGS